MNMKTQVPIRAICFDLGDTLIHYEGIPLNWSQHYSNALCIGMKKNNYVWNEKELDECSKILMKYNTRAHPRNNEISAEIIFSEIASYLNIDKEQSNVLMECFYNYFQQRSILFEDVETTLKSIKDFGIKVGILTDVAYGMPNSYVLKDIEKIKQYIDVVLTSVDVGYRKPMTNGYCDMAKKLDVFPNEMIYVGNEEKDIVGANRANAISVFINRTDKKCSYGECYQYESIEEMWKNIKTKIAV